MSQAEAFGRYQLLKVLARGGMGEVWLARQGSIQGFEKLVVIKRILPHLAEDEEFVNMFLDEARIAARLNHPNIVQIFDLGQEGEYYYLTMEYIHGDDVRRIWKHAHVAGKKIPVALTCRFIADAAAGLDFAHKKSDEKGEPLHIVHRDISPHNILVTFDGGVKVIDFGIARARGRISHTATGALKGRFEYMSPEHAAGLSVDHRSDLFALGVVMWETLTGVRLFKRDSETATLMAVSECKVEPPSKWNADVDPALDAIVLKSLAVLRDDRFEDCAALRLALENWIVQSRQSGSSAHLAAFMAEIYVERLATEAKLGHPVVEEHSHTGATANRKAEEATRARKADANTQTGTSSSAPTQAGGPPHAQAQKSKLPVLAIGAVAVLLVAIGVVVALKAPPPAPAPVVVAAPAPAPAPVAAPAPVVPAEAPAPTEVTLHFLSDPSGASVYIDGMEIGKTPKDWAIPRSNAAKNLELKLAGYRPYAQTVVPFESSTVSAKLVKAAQKVEKPAEKPADPPPLDIKFGR